MKKANRLKSLGIGRRNKSTHVRSTPVSSTLKSAARKIRNRLSLRPQVFLAQLCIYVSCSEAISEEKNEVNNTQHNLQIHLKVTAPIACDFLWSRVFQQRPKIYYVLEVR